MEAQLRKIQDMLSIVQSQQAEILRRGLVDNSSQRVKIENQNFGGHTAVVEHVDTVNDGNHYTGEVNSAGERHGRGKLVGCGHYNRGNWYEGEFRNNQKHGEGVYHYKDGKTYGHAYSGGTYTGQFENDKRQGSGEMRFNNGDVFSGKWKNNKMLAGTMTYANGSVYRGHWKEGKWHGQGCYRDVYGVVNTSVWNKGVDLSGRSFLTHQSTTSTSAPTAPVANAASGQLYHPQYEALQPLSGLKRKAV